MCPEENAVMDKPATDPNYDIQPAMDEHSVDIDRKAQTLVVQDDEMDYQLSRLKPAPRFHQPRDRPLWARVVTVLALLSLTAIILTRASSIVRSVHVPPYLSGVKASTVQVFSRLNEAKRKLVDSIH
jgi:hypothetical protein